MTQTQSKATPVGERTNGVPAGFNGVPPTISRTVPRRRRKSLIALAVVLVAVGILVGAYAITRVSDRVSVLIVARHVDLGAPISAADIGTTQISADPGIATIPAAQRGVLDGARAAVTMTPGTLVSTQMLTRASAPAPGQEVVPLSLPAGRLPARGLAAGTNVLLVPAVSQDSAKSDSDAPKLASPIPATVVTVGPADVNGARTVDVAVTSAKGPTVAGASTAGTVALVLVNQGS